MKHVPAVLAALLLSATVASAQTPDGASKTPEGDKPTPQETAKDPAEKESLTKAPDQQDLPPEGTTPPEPSATTKEAK